jgi:vitamin K-dependent gamma-carboxylase
VANAEAGAWNAAAPRPEPTGVDRLVNACLAPVDAAGLAVFRIGFGLLMAWWCFDDLSTGRVHNLYEVPRFHFNYFPFDFIRPWPGAGMTIHFGALLLLALCIAAGLVYRVASILFALGFTYFFLLDRANYQNHYYLIALLSWTIALLPLHREWSLDVLNGNTPRSPVLPAWMLALVRFHVALPYVFGGIAKLDSDWFAGEPMRQVLAGHAEFPVIGSWLATESAVQFFTWGGLLFDLAIVPLLLWRPTRIPAYLIALAFHAANAYLFNIHVFPWFMMLATTVFLDPAWPRKLLNMSSSRVLWKSEQGPDIRWAGLRRRSRFGFGLLAAYCLFHLVWPLRHFAYGPDTGWTEQGHFFSWRMMLRVKDSGMRYFLVDKTAGMTESPEIYDFVNQEQSQKFSRDPEMILDFAHFLAGQYRSKTGRQPSVHALVLTSLNGRKPQLLIDPNVDLAQEPRGFHRRSWIVNLTEPLSSQPWRVPLNEWATHVDIPPLKFLAIQPHDVQVKEPATTPGVPSLTPDRPRRSSGQTVLAKPAPAK